MTQLFKVIDGVDVPLSEYDLALIENDAENVIEEQWRIVRLERNISLAASDWTQLPDAPVDAAAWAEYRQALRNITMQPDPFNIVWPTTPGA